MPKAPPLIAVAFDSCMHIYRNQKFFHKYEVPTPVIDENEMEIWRQVRLFFCREVETKTG